MKKFGIIAILLLVLTAGGIGAAHFVMDGQKNDVTITETTLAGDKSQADGITIKAKFEDIRNTLNWWTTYSTTEGQVVQCETDLKSDDEVMPLFIQLRTETLNYGVDDPEDTELVARIGENKTGIPASDVLAKINAAEKNKVTKYNYDLTDYMDYFPVWIGSSLPDQATLHYDKMSGAGFWDDPYMKNYQYFKVPVPKDLKGVLKVKKDEEGNLKSWNMGVNDNLFEVESEGLLDEDCLYLATSGLGRQYDKIDFEAEVDDYYYHILDMPEETHGIHQIPIAGNGKSYIVDLEHAKLVYGFDKNEKVLALEMSHSGKELLLYTKVDDDIFLSIIDKASMTCLQKTLLFEDTYQIFGLIQKENFLLSISAYKDFVLMDTADGTYKEIFRGNLGEFSKLIGMQHCSADYDGERLAFVKCDEQDVEGLTTLSCYTLQVFTAQGLTYHGVYTSNLATSDKTQSISFNYETQPIEVSFDEIDD